MFTTHVKYLVSNLAFGLRFHTGNAMGWTFFLFIKEHVQKTPEINGLKFSEKGQHEFKSFSWC